MRSQQQQSPDDDDDDVDVENEKNIVNQNLCLEKRKFATEDTERLHDIYLKAVKIRTAMTVRSFISL